MSAEYVLAATFEWPEHAEAMRQRLEEEGIPARLAPVADADKADMGPDAVQLEVPAEYLDQVDNILADAGGMHEPEVEQPGTWWICPRCGERSRTERFTCPTCRALRRSTGNGGAAPPALPADEALVPAADETTTPASSSADESTFKVPTVGSVQRYDWHGVDVLVGLFGLTILGPAFSLLLGGHGHWSCGFPLAYLGGFSLWRLTQLSGAVSLNRRKGCLSLVFVLLYLSIVTLEIVLFFALLTKTL